jgi:flagellar protein FlbD
MLLLTRLDNSRVLVNLETVKFMESAPDTVIAFVNGDSMIVRETLDDIDRRVAEYRARVLTLARGPSQPPG